MASLWRSTVWFLNGWWNYGKSGFERRAKSFLPADLTVDMSDKIAIVTGANSGLGLETSFQLANRGAQVHMLCRSKERGLAAIDELAKRNGAVSDITDRLILHKVDVSSIKEIQEFVEGFESGKLDILVNNAGCMVDGRKLSADGVEINFATNVLSPYLLTEKLIPKLSKTDSIVLTVTSGGALTAKLEPIDLELKSKEPLKGIEAYAQNKRQQMEMTAHWTQKYSSSGIFFCTAHPGWADTPAVRSSMPEFYEKMKNELRTAEQGADTIVWAVVCERIRKEFPNGSFFEDRNAVSEHLPLSGTRSSEKARNLFIQNLDALIQSKSLL